MEKKTIKIFVVGILTKNGKYLAERRHKSEEHFGGLLVFPGGLIETDESPEKALAREMREELSIEVQQSRYVGEFSYEDGHKSKVYLVNKWKGEPVAEEAESLHWVEKVEELSNKFDRKVLEKIGQVDTMKTSEKLFVYGTLRDPETQEKVFGRTAKGIPDALVGYKRGEIVIEGETYPLAVPSEGEKIEGLVIEIFEEELRKIDEYETSAYKRIQVRLQSGTMAWVYVKGYG